MKNTLLFILIQFISISIFGQYLDLVKTEKFVNYKTDSYSIEIIQNKTYSIFSPTRKLFKENDNGWTAYEFIKAKTPRIMASTFANVKGINGGRKIIFFGKCNNQSSRKVIIKDFDNLSDNARVINCNNFFKKTLRNSKGQFNHLNIQGATSVGSLMILVNSAKLGSKKDNYLIVTSTNFFNQKDLLCPNISDVRIRKISNSKNITITGLTYIPENKTLIFSAIKEVNNKIESLIGWITDFENNLTDNLELKPNDIINLYYYNPIFENVRIESVAFQNSNLDNFTLKLLSNEEKLGSRIFTVNLNFKTK